MGMTADEYWFADPHLLDNYEIAYKNKRRVEKNNAWLAGGYVRAALQSTVLVSGLASRKVIEHMPKYPEFESSSERYENMTEMDKKRERKRLFDFFKSMAPQKKGGN